MNELKHNPPGLDRLVQAQQSAEPHRLRYEIGDLWDGPDVPRTLSVEIRHDGHVYKGELTLVEEEARDGMA